MIYFFVRNRKCRGFRLCTGDCRELFRLLDLPVDFSDLFFFGGDQERKLFSVRLRLIQA